MADWLRPLWVRFLLFSILAGFVVFCAKTFAQVNFLCYAAMMSVRECASISIACILGAIVGVVMCRRLLKYLPRNEGDSDDSDS